MSIPNADLQRFYAAAVKAARKAGIPDSQIPRGEVTVTLEDESATFNARKPSSY